MKITQNPQALFPHQPLGGIIFDMDGLIFDSERRFFLHLKNAAKPYGYQITEEKYKQTLGLTGETLTSTLHRLYGTAYPCDAINQAARAAMMQDISLHGLPVKKGILSLLTVLKNHTIPCAIASSTKKEYILSYLHKMQLSSYFSVILGGDMITHSKPAPDIFQKACELLHILPSHAIVLEDSENGILAAHRAAIPVICIPDLKYPEKEYAGYPFLIADSAEAVIPFLQNSAIL